MLYKYINVLICFELLKINKLTLKGYIECNQCYTIMSLPKLEIKSKVVQRGNSYYLLLPPPIKHNCGIEPKDVCTIELSPQKKIQITF